MDNIECVSVSDLDEDEIHHHHQQQQQQQHHGIHPHPHHHSEFSSSKPRNGNNVNGVNIVGPTGIAPATSVHELLECPVCTNSMYPPIHQVSCLLYLLVFSLENDMFIIVLEFYAVLYVFCAYGFLFCLLENCLLGYACGIWWGSGVGSSEFGELGLKEINWHISDLACFGDSFGDWLLGNGFG